MKKAPELKLPAAAAGLWSRVRNVVEDATASLGDKPVRYRMGGGTILAARWGHRESFDVDLTLPEDTALGRLREDQGDRSGFEARLRALDGTPRYFPDLKLWRVAFEDGKRGLDLWAHEPEIGAGEERRTVDGNAETVLSTAQILRGKLERADKRLARDIFDIVKAEAKAPDALESAVNAISAESAEHIALDWYWNGAVIAEEARTRLQGVPDKERVDPAKLGNLAAHAIRGAIYTHYRIQTQDGGIDVTTATRRRPPQTVRITADEAAKAFEARGFNSYLETAGPGARELREYALAECASGRNVLVLNVEPNKPTQWRAERTSGNLTPGRALRADKPDPPESQPRKRESWKR